ncbi:MAG: isocitrate/isopropylmalate family dehydrogenase [Candidatus Bipolaricaulota bacterium]
MTKQVVVIPGDGVGPEVTGAVVEVLQKLRVDLNFSTYRAGDKVKEETGKALPDDTLQAATDADAVLLGAVGNTAADVVIRLRQELDTFVNLRPTKAFSGVDCLNPDVDLVIVRENTECLYSGIEHELSDDVTTATRVITKKASERIARYAFDYAKSEGYSRVTAIHKNNVLPVTGNRFLEAVEEVAGEYEGEVEYEDLLVDATAMYIVMNPERFDVIVTTNLFGDILSDEAAGLVGGLGLSPSANIGDDHGIFEPVHGTAPDIAGENVANPTATILSAGYMLKFLGYPEIATDLEKAVDETISAGETTPDLGGDMSTTEMSRAVLERTKYE